MEINDYVNQFRDLQKSHKKVKVADFCRENMLDYYEMVDALKQFLADAGIPSVIYYPCLCRSRRPLSQSPLL